MYLDWFVLALIVNRRHIVESFYLATHISFVVFHPARVRNNDFLYIRVRCHTINIITQTMFSKKKRETTTQTKRSKITKWKEKKNNRRIFSFGWYKSRYLVADVVVYLPHSRSISQTHSVSEESLHRFLCHITAFVHRWWGWLRS